VQPHYQQLRPQIEDEILAEIRAGFAGAPTVTWTQEHDNEFSELIYAQMKRPSFPHSMASRGNRSAA